MDGIYEKSLSMKKCIVVVDENLPNGLKTNVAAILSMSLGRSHPEIVGPDLKNADDVPYNGITTIPIPILQGNCEQLKDLHVTAHLAADYSAAFTDSALRTKNYQAYTADLEDSLQSKTTIHGVLVYGDAGKVKKLSAHLTLMK